MEKVLDDAHKFWKRSNFGEKASYAEFLSSLGQDMTQIIHPKDLDSFDFEIEKEKIFLDYANGIIPTDKEERNILKPVVPQAFHIPKDNIKNVKLVALLKNPGFDNTFKIEKKYLNEQERYRKSLIGEDSFLPWTKEDGWHFDHFKKSHNSIMELLGIEDNEVAQIEFFPYQVPSKKEIPKKFVTLAKTKFQPLESQKYNFDLFKYFLTETTSIFIARDWKSWNFLIETQLFKADEEQRDYYKEEFKRRSFTPNNPRRYYLTTDSIRPIHKSHVELSIKKLFDEEDNK